MGASLLAVAKPIYYFGSKVDWKQGFHYPAQLFPPTPQFFSVGSKVFIPEIQSSCQGSKVITPDPRFYFRSINSIQFNIPILEFEHVTSLKDCCSVFLNQGKNFFSVLVFRITSYGRTATKSIDLICKQKNVARAAQIFVPFARLQQSFTVLPRLRRENA